MRCRQRYPTASGGAAAQPRSRLNLTRTKSIQPANSAALALTHPTASSGAAAQTCGARLSLTKPTLAIQPANSGVLTLTEPTANSGAATQTCRARLSLTKPTLAIQPSNQRRLSPNRTNREQRRGKPTHCRLPAPLALTRTEPRQSNQATNPHPPAAATEMRI